MKSFIKKAQLNFELIMVSISFGVTIGIIICSVDLYRPYYESIFGTTFSYIVASVMSCVKVMSLNFNPSKIGLEFAVYSALASILSFIILKLIVSFRNANTV